MSDIVVRPSHVIRFKTIRVGNESVIPDEIKILETQYIVLKDALNNDRFVEVNGEMFNTSEVHSVVKMPEPKRDFPERYKYDSDAAFEKAQEEFKKQK